MRLSPQRLSRWLLAAVALFTLCVVVVLVVRGRLAGVPDDLPPTRADFRIRDVHLEEQEGSRVRWTLTADQAELYDREGRTVLRKVRVTIEEPDRTWTVTGEEGDLIEATKDVEIRKNVVLVSSDGIRLETDRLAWHAKDRRVWTGDPVTVFRPGAVIQGQGLEAWIAEERAQIKGRIRATFAGDAPGRRAR
jgi:LPS export ABC transporter protein LptC